MEGDGGGFGAAVVDQAWAGDVGGEGGDGYERAVVGGRDGGEEFSRQAVV